MPLHLLYCVGLTTGHWALKGSSGSVLAEGSAPLINYREAAAARSHSRAKATVRVPEAQRVLSVDICCCCSASSFRWPFLPRGEEIGRGVANEPMCVDQKRLEQKSECPFHPLTCEITPQGHLARHSACACLPACLLAVHTCTRTLAPTRAQCHLKPPSRPEVLNKPLKRLWWGNAGVSPVNAFTPRKHLEAFFFKFVFVKKYNLSKLGPSQQQSQACKCVSCKT